MLPSMKFYVVSIVSIFTALGLGIYIGFSMDTEDFITERQESLIEIVESNFEVITNENEALLSSNEELIYRDKSKSEYINESYQYILPSRLEGLNIAIVETNPDYVVSGLGRDLEFAGGNVVSVTSVKDKMLELDKSKNDFKILVKGILNPDESDSIYKLAENGYIDILGDYTSKIDIVILSGGNRSSYIDKEIIDMCKSKGINILGVEKSNSKESYIGKYKEFNIPTIDNIDSKMGKVAMVLSLEGSPGNYGVKGTSDSILPIKK